MSGHLLEFLRMIALSIEKLSLGSCCELVQIPIVRGSLSTF